MKKFMMNFSERKKKKMFKVYTDGACKGNGKTSAKGGWAFAIYDESDNLLFAKSGHEEGTTNQRMEINAILQACDVIAAIAKLSKNEVFSCNIHSDSAYCIRCYTEAWYSRWETNGWKTAGREPVKNKDLWERLVPYFKDSRFNFIKVKGHADCEQNNFVDELAQSAAVADPVENKYEHYEGCVL